ncbi:ATP-utilizing chromatin assembly and remodelling N-terminal-domain-containing protein [Aspergillus desertorum]
MVLFKRKPVQYLPRPVIEDDSSEVWVISETNEVFTNYESYLQRMDFYKQRKFICEITGHSGLNFFEAFRSEMEESREVNNSFPEALKGPILRRVQFSTVSRVDNLVDEIYEEFKSEFYPGEPVLILLDDNTRLHGVIRDKAKFPEQLYPDGTVRTPAHATYLVRVLDRPDEEALLDNHHITRDRKTFTKQMLRAFIKNNVTRESWNGAPWLVKPSVAEEYRIPTEVPKHLQYGARVAEKKAQKKADQEGFFGFFASKELPELKPAVKGQKAKPSAQDLARSEEAQFLEYKRSLNGNPSFLVGNKPANGPPRPSKSQELENAQPVASVVIKAEPTRPPSPPPIKYPIEDLEIPPNREKKKQRPPLKFLKSNELDDPDDEDLLQDALEMESVGPLLETWNTLNVYCEVFQLDSFTFDDFLQAMRFSSNEMDCELFVEIHCAVLKKLVNAEKDNNGAIQISLPELPVDQSEDSDEDEEMEEDEQIETEATPEPAVTRMTTRGSLAKAEAEGLKALANNDPDSSEIRTHRASEMFAEYGWIERLRRRDFRNGGWEMIMVGLLHQLSVRPRMEKVCNQILERLAPLDQEPTQDTARAQYAVLDVNLRIRALQIICMLSLETKAIRNYLEECSNQMTEFRKEKIEYQKARKAAMEEVRRLHQECKALAPEPEKSPSPLPELEAAEDTKMSGMDGDSQVDSEVEGTPQRALRGGVDRVMERKRKLEEQRERKEQLAKQPKGSKQYLRLLKKLDEQKAAVKKYEDKIAVIDNDLREADCPRTRCLGKDRFCNRYWWFERNAMPYGGMPNSSTAEAKYANGRLWVQGPDDMERLGFIDVSDDLKKHYQKRFHMSPAERKKHEEGSTRLSGANEWGYYDEPEAIEKLLDWLDSRGERETKLRKELLLHRDKLVKCMQARHEYLSRTEDDSEDMPTKRVTTRNKTYVADAKHRCLNWRNSTALADNGHLHVDASRPSKRARKSGEDLREVKATNRQGKPLTRQGGRYNF